MKTIHFFFITLFFIYGCKGQEKSPILDANSLNPKIDALVQQYIDLDIFSGVILVAEHGKPIYHKAFGLAQREKGIPNTLNTKFDIGSMNKTFTKVVILQLLQEGKLKLDDNLGTYLDGFPKEAADRITIEHLLDHSSGYGDYFTEDYFHASSNEKTISGLLKQIKKMPLLFEPGEEQEYSNAGYIVLGAMIEAITGKTYYENVKERILTPLQLKDTYVENKNLVPERSIGYYKTMKGELLNNDELIEIPKPDGGFQSTTLDILKFYKEYHYGTTLLQEETKMQDGYYHAMQTHNTTGGAIPHVGGFNGANTAFYEILRDKISVIVFANMDEPVAEQIGPGILALIRGKEPKKPSLPAIQNVYKAYTQHGIGYVKEHFTDLIDNFHPTDPKGIILNDMGYEFLFENKIDQALEIFALNTELFPEDPNVWDSFGEAYAKAGKKADAIASYKKALAIDPQFPSALRMLQELEKGNK